jgi:lipooligosaccharide transport system ATP-binding protein
MQILKVDGVIKRYANIPVVNGIHFELRQGECFGLLGPNGAGKTTTLRLCLGLTAPDKGKINILNLEIPRYAREARMRIGVVPQMDNLDPDFSVAENLLVYGRYFGLPDKLIRERIPSLLAFASLENKADSPIATLSGGMKRRLTLARALVNNPDLIFLDEPTNGLDPQARHLLWERLRKLLSQGKTIFLTTHFMDEAERLCDRVLVMDHGQAIALGSPQYLIQQNIEPEVIEVYGETASTWLKDKGIRLSDRTEIAGETAFCYTRSPAPLLTELQNQSRLRNLHRPANLEDVFLKLTGREMRD